MKKIAIAFVICFTSTKSSAQFQSPQVHVHVTKHVGHRIAHKHRYSLKIKHRKIKNNVSIIKNKVYKKYSMSLDSAITNDSILNNFVKLWIGARYVWGGASPRGVDCSGFTKILYDSVYHLTIPRTAKEQFKVYGNNDIDSLKSGNLIFFKVPNKKTGWHVGVYLTNGYFIHASGHKTGVIISKLNDYYINHLVEI
jgi:cell wall-associated NlpC family hydrolase